MQQPENKPINILNSSESKTEQNINNLPEFAIQRIYIKDLSFESPNSPAVFRTDWSPQVGLDLNTTVNNLTENVYEVVLKVTATVKSDDKVGFLVEVQQAGIFILKGFPQENLQYLLGSGCPNILFPYVREVISDVVSRGTFPPFYLSPVNFDALFQQYLERQKAEETKAEVGSGEGGELI